MTAVRGVLERRLNTLLPPMYRERYTTMVPRSMGSAGLRFDDEGRVAWDRMWGSFCNLAMAGGPPHKGRLLEPASEAAVSADTTRYAEVVAEIGRGITLATGLPVVPSAPGSAPGWIRIGCANDTMAAWMLRAIVMENVSARQHNSWLELPAGPAFRLEKEIKNVITVVAKTAHYWRDHMPRATQFAVAQTLAEMDAEHPLLTPAAPAASPAATEAARKGLADEVLRASGLHEAGLAYSGWMGFACGTISEAVALMRMVLMSNVLVRREETVLYLPVNPARDPRGRLAAEALRRAQGVILPADRATTATLSDAG